MTPEGLITSLKEGPHWRVNFYPLEYNAQRVASGKTLLEMVRKHKVAFRGWDYPHVDTKGQIAVTRDSATSWTEFMHSREVWRFFRSGQFVNLFAMIEEDPEFERALARRFPRMGAATSFMSIDSVVYVVTEIYEFASRLASEGLFDAGIHLSIELHGARGRGLSFDSLKRALNNAYVASQDTIVFDADHGVEEVRGESAELAAATASEIFADFGASFPPNMVRDIQKELRGFRQ